MPYVTSWERLAKAEGERDGLLAGIEECLELKFGADGLQLLPEVQQIADNTVLEAVFKSIKNTTMPGDLRRLWSPGS
jgi:hypothetical protein